MEAIEFADSFNFIKVRPHFVEQDIQQFPAFGPRSGSLGPPSSTGLGYVAHRAEGFEQCSGKSLSAGSLLWPPSRSNVVRIVSMIVELG